jgi:hypothetical protein
VEIVRAFLFSPERGRGKGRELKKFIANAILRLTTLGGGVD